MDPYREDARTLASERALIMTRAVALDASSCETRAPDTPQTYPARRWGFYLIGPKLRMISL